MATQSTDFTLASWRKSSYSDTGGNCVEVAQVGTAYAVRDSKKPDDGHLVLSANAWATFTESIKYGAHAL